MRTKGTPFLNVKPPDGLTAAQRQTLLGDLNALSEMHRACREDDSNLAARIASYELAFRMQTETP